MRFVPDALRDQHWSVRFLWVAVCFTAAWTVLGVAAILLVSLAS